MTDVLLLDSHAALWLMDGTPMSDESREAIRNAVQTPASVLLSPITAWEVALAHSRGRVRLSKSPLAWYFDVVALPGFAEVELDADILVASESLPGNLHRDPADRFLVATARCRGLKLVTRDRKILDYAAAGHVATVRC